MLKNYHHHIYYFSLILLVVALPLSVFLLSLAQIILILNWLLEKNFREKFELMNKHGIYAFITIYLVHIAGMFYSSDLAYGFHDLKIKLPLLILPLVIGTTKPLSPFRFKSIVAVFCAAVFASTVISTGKLLGWWGEPVSDIRDISIFISHIRLSLMVNMSIFILLWLTGSGNKTILNVALIMLSLWFVLFLFLLKSLTGIVILFILALFFGIRSLLAMKNMMARWFLLTGICLVVLLSAGYLSHSVARFSYTEKTDLSSLDTFTRNGNFYIHDTISPDIENGFRTWLYVCDRELEPEWNKRSRLNYKGTDLKGQELRYTLVRYMTSKGLRKDSAGLSLLNESDIRNIELGLANHIYAQKFSFYPRIYQLLWEIRQYRNGGNPSGHSFTQRLEYLSTGWNVASKNFWFGVGTGDVDRAFKEQYQLQNSKLVPRWQLRAHNQFLTFLLTFGIFGFLLIMGAFLYPVFKLKKWNNYLVLLFLIVSFLSFINEDTLETHAGISFFAFFVSFLLFTSPSEHEP